MSTIVYNENTRRTAEKKEMHYRHLNLRRSIEGGATLDGILLELVYGVASSRSDLEAQAHLIELHELVDSALEGMAIAQEEADYIDSLQEAQPYDEERGEGASE